MIRLAWLLGLLVAVELVVGGILVARRHNLPVPPRPRLELFNRETTAALERARAAVRAESPQDWAELAEVYLAHGYYPEAEACHRQACKLAPDDAELRGLWAFCLSRMGYLEEALAEFRRAIESGHERPEQLWYFAGRDYLRLERPADARNAFAQARSLPAARYELARLALRDGQPAEALPLLQELEQETPRAFAPLWLRARAEAEAGRKQAAEQYDERAAAADQRLPTPFDQHSERIIQAHRRLGLARRWQRAKELLEAERYEAARALVEEGLQVQWSPEGADLLADVAYAQGRLEESRQLLEEIVRREGPSLHWLWRYGDACQELGHGDEAYRAWRHAVGLGPESEGKGLYVKLSQYHTELGETDQADRFKAAFYCAAGVELLRSGELPPASASFREAITHDAESSRAWFYLGECLRRLGQGSQARQAYQRCLALQPEHGRARRRLAEATDVPQSP